MSLYHYTDYNGFIGILTDGEISAGGGSFGVGVCESILKPLQRLL